MYQEPTLRIIERDDAPGNPVMNNPGTGCCECGGQGNSTTCCVV